LAKLFKMLRLNRGCILTFCGMCGAALWGHCHSRCARSLRGRAFLGLLRPHAACAGPLFGGIVIRQIRDARAPCGDAFFSASCDPPLVACAGPLCGAFEMRALLVGPLFSPPPATRRARHVRGRSCASCAGHSRCARSLRGCTFSGGTGPLPRTIRVGRLLFAEMGLERTGRAREKKTLLVACCGGIVSATSLPSPRGWGFDRGVL